MMHQIINESKIIEARQRHQPLTIPFLLFLPFPLPISTTPTLTATLSPSGTLEIGPELLLTPPPLETLFDSSLLSSALEILDYDYDYDYELTDQIYRSPVILNGLS